MTIDRVSALVSKAARWWWQEPVLCKFEGSLWINFSILINSLSDAYGFTVLCRRYLRDEMRFLPERYISGLSMLRFVIGIRLRVVSPAANYNYWHRLPRVCETCGWFRAVFAGSSMTSRVSIHFRGWDTSTFLDPTLSSLLTRGISSKTRNFSENLCPTIALRRSRI